MLTDIEMNHGDDVPLEEKEQWLLDREAVTDAQNEHTKIERVIGVEEDETGETSYFIKCMPFLQPMPSWTNGL